MVTSRASLFARIATAEDWGKRQPLAPAQSLLLQRLLGDGMGEKGGGSPKRAGATLKKARRKKKGKRPPAVLLPARYHCHPLHHHRPGVCKRNSLESGQCGLQSRGYKTNAGCGAEHLSPGTGGGAARPGGEKPTTGSEEGAPRAAQYKHLRKEVLKAKMGKLEKTISHGQPGYSIHRYEQPNFHKQKTKCYMPLKIPSAKENNCWQNSVAFDMLSNHEKKPLNNTDNFINVKLKNSVFLFEVDQKENNYAGAKFSDPPSPSVLPKPPSHWVGSTVQHSDQSRELMAVHLKTLLKVQA